jgi:alpha-amylase
MRQYSIFDIAESPDYFDAVSNKAICRKVAEKCYLPANAMMLDLIKQNPDFKIAYSISGVALEQFAEYAPDVLASFQALVATGNVEILSETYYHSLAALFNADEFRAQIIKHRETVQHYLGVTPRVFRNTELIYSNGIADMVEDLGYAAMITEGVDRVLDWRSPNFVYQPHHGRGMRLLLKNYQLSDDIAFRFSEKSWPGWPMTADKFAGWLRDLDGNAQTINLFMDYETIGEHQWEHTGIFEFFRALPTAIYRHTNFDFATPSEVIDRYPVHDRISIPETISWADEARDLSAWLGNPMQDNSIAWVYRLGDRVIQSGDSHLLHQWRKLQTSDHFYYMCTKFWSDGDVHKYFSAYDSPHESYVLMSNILTDLETRLKAYPSQPAHPAHGELPQADHSIQNVHVAEMIPTPAKKPRKSPANPKKAARTATKK